MAGRITHVPVEVVRAAAGAGAALASQACVEVVRDGAGAGAAVASQACVEVLVPYISLTDKYADAAAALVLTATAAEPAVQPGAADYAKAASASFALAAAAAVDSVLHVYAASASAAIVLAPAAAVDSVAFARDASAALVLTATAAVDAVAHVYAAAATPATLVLTAAAGAVLAVGERAASATIVFRTRARVTTPEVVFGDGYLGRFQVGQEVPLWAIVLDQKGSPRDPTTVPPTATVYDLGLAARVEAVDLPRLRGSRAGQVYARPLRLGARYAPGRYGVLYRASTGGFTGLTLATFEVAAGGDARGPVQAAYAADGPSGWTFLTHTGSGALVTGRRPGVD